MDVFTYHMSGKVLPERVNANFILPMLHVKEPTFGYEFDISTSIQLSQISIEITSQAEITDFATLRNIVRDFIRLHTDAYGYLYGYAYDVEITSISGKNNIPHLIYGIEIKEIEIDHPNRPLREFADIVKLMHDGSNNELRLALNDLRLSIQHPTDTAVFCFRAIESLMQYFGPKAESTWETFRDSLNISRDFLKPTEDKCWSPRHGKPIPISHSERVDIMMRSWKIVDRFVIYLQNSCKPLDKSKYPKL